MPRYLTLESDLDVENWNAPRLTMSQWEARKAKAEERFTEERYLNILATRREEEARKALKAKMAEAAKLQASLFQHFDPVRGWTGGTMESDGSLKARIEEALDLSPADLPRARRTFQQRERFAFKTQAQARQERTSRARRRVRAPGACSPEARVYQMLDDNGEEFDTLDGWFKSFTSAVTGAVKAVAAPVAKAVKVTAKAVKPVAKAVATAGKATGKALTVAGETTAKGFAKYMEESWSIRNYNTPGRFLKNTFVPSGGYLGSSGKQAYHVNTDGASPYLTMLGRIAKSAAQATAAVVSAKAGGETKTSSILNLMAGKPTGKFGEALEALPLLVGKPATLERVGETVNISTMGSDGLPIEASYDLSQLAPEARSLPQGTVFPLDASSDYSRGGLGGALAPVAGGNDETASSDEPSFGAIVAKETAMPILLTLGAAFLIFMAVKPKSPSMARS